MRTKTLLVVLPFTVLPGAVLYAGCAGGGDIGAFVKLDTEKAAAFEVGGDDCDAKAKSVKEWRAANNARYRELQQKLNAKYPDGPPDRHKEQLGKNKKAIVRATLKCAKNTAFGEALQSTE